MGPLNDHWKVKSPVQSPLSTTDTSQCRSQGPQGLITDAPVHPRDLKNRVFFIHSRHVLLRHKMCCLIVCVQCLPLTNCRGNSKVKIRLKLTRRIAVLQLFLCYRNFGPFSQFNFEVLNLDFWILCFVSLCRLHEHYLFSMLRCEDCKHIAIMSGQYQDSSWPCYTGRFIYFSFLAFFHVFRDGIFGLVVKCVQCCPLVSFVSS